MSFILQPRTVQVKNIVLYIVWKNLANVIGFIISVLRANVVIKFLNIEFNGSKINDKKSIEIR